jgi:phosphoglycolate phosphatase
MPTQTVLFDLDGTLLDTAPDLADALNTVLLENRRAPLAYSEIRGVVSHGGIALIRLGFQLDESSPEFEALRRRLLNVYRDNLSNKTRLFPGMSEALGQLEQRDINWGVVTNKPAWLTEPLLRELGLFERSACVVSGDTLPERKPHPAPMLHACGQAGCRPEQCVCVGDARRDIEAGRNAGMRTLVALFGYFLASDRPREWNADGMLETPLDLIRWLDAEGADTTVL